MNKKRVLVIDDEKQFVRMVKINLELTGEYDVLGLSDPHETVASVHKFKPDIILLDVIMPQLSGLQVCKLINDDPHGSNIPIIILSALKEDLDRFNAYKLGVAHYLIKPVETQDIISAIEVTLRFHRKPE
jgi:two-component system phosphate regulon response regulator PhoB